MLPTASHSQLRRHHRPTASAAALGNCVRSSETVSENPIAMTVDKPMNPPVVPDDGLADSIIPISAKGEHGFWFSIQTDSPMVPWLSSLKTSENFENNLLWKIGYGSGIDEVEGLFICL
nr:peptide-N4-(N-acetyl-beta-glucosaminyl) asparagine amidase A-like [Ipomoea batatas]